ncbi:hypothetical protein JB92DRAFT_2871400 [Gautieria morchelliformis]|nr:hypothetical protein JB92DRAFT_2871400 [Gautieria morchelliformis]
MTFHTRSRVKSHRGRGTKSRRESLLKCSEESQKEKEGIWLRESSRRNGETEMKLKKSSEGKKRRERMRMTGDVTNEREEPRSPAEEDKELKRVTVEMIDEVRDEAAQKNEGKDVCREEGMTGENHGGGEARVSDAEESEGRSVPKYPSMGPLTNPSSIKHERKKKYAALLNEAAVMAQRDRARWRT